MAGAVGLCAQPVRLYLANDDHTDYMWTADAETYNAVFVDMLDYYLRLADETKENPSPYRSRFNADGSYWLWQYERRKSPAEFERLNLSPQIRAEAVSLEQFAQLAQGLLCHQK